MKTILVTGGAGFIGANLVSYLHEFTDYRIVNLDRLTYAGHRENLRDLDASDRHVFVEGDISDADLIEKLLADHRPVAIMNLAAESHVDRSISHPDTFIQTNIVGVFNLLDKARKYWQSLPKEEAEEFRFLQVSTDEVYGSLLPDDPAFSEDHRYQPNSPYSASKAAADHLARAWFHTYGMPVLTTNCSNNYGPLQFPEKLIPVIIHNALAGEAIPIYGDGSNIRDWLYVEDHCRGLHRVLEQGEAGQTYNIGGQCEKSNLDLARTVCELLDELKPRGDSYRKLITLVHNRPGHDFRYAIDNSKIQHLLGWKPEVSFEDGLRKTVAWYLDNQAWCETVLANAKSRD